jgi:hypothetical protein
VPRPKADEQRTQVLERVLDSGYFDGPAFADLLGVVFRKRLTGTLHVTHQKVTKGIHFLHGVPRWVSTGVPSEREGLRRRPAKQLAAIVTDVFSWFGGSFRLVEGPAPAEMVVPAPSVLALIHEGSACFSSDQLRAIAFRLDGVVLPASVASAVPAEQPLGEEEQRLLREIDGSRTIGALLGTVTDDGGVRLLYALHCVARSSPEAQPSDEVQTPPQVAPPAPLPELGRIETGRLLAAEGQFHRAKALLARKKLKAAYARLVEATELDSDEGDYHAYLGWTVFQMSPHNPLALKVAFDELAKAVALNPQGDKGYLLRGYIHEARGELDRARADFEQALQLGQDRHEALRALRRMNERVA